MSDWQNDIIRYKRGELSPKEMHALEKKALSDPFLADALEGLENISSENLVKDVAELNQKIAKPGKTILFTPLRIAAGVILIAASVFVVYQFSPKHEDLALKTEKPAAPTASPKTEVLKPEEKPKTQVQKAEESKKNVATAKSPRVDGEKSGATKGPDEGDKIKAGQLEIATATKPKTEQPSVAETQALVLQDKLAETKDDVKKEQAPVSVAMEPVKESAAEDLKQTERAVGRMAKAKFKSDVPSGVAAGASQIGSKRITGKVISAEDGAPLPGVNVVIAGTTQGTVTDGQGNFSLQPSSADQKLVFSFIGLQTQEVSIGGKDKVDVTLKQDVSQLSEVVVSGFGAKRDDDAEPIVHLASPVGGTRAYNKYLDANVRYPQEALKNNIKGKVKVEFSVKTDGSLDDYKVVKSLGYGCDEEVIRLIKDGPKWSPSTENGQPVESTVLVGVKFDPAKSGR